MRKILIIDDDPLVRQSVAKVLGREGYATVLAASAAEGVQKSLGEEFDLIISDIRMPGKNGVEAIGEIRNLFNQNHRKDLPIIFITGYSESSDEMKAEHLGEVILKPFDLQKLVMTVREYL